MADPITPLIGALLLAGRFLPKQMRHPVEGTIANVLGCNYWIVGPLGSGKATLHKILADEDVAIGVHNKTPRVANTTSGIGIIGDRSQRFILHQKGFDAGGENCRPDDPTSEPLFLDAWKANVLQAHRFIFVYDLKSEFGDVFTLRRHPLTGKPERVIDFEGKHWIENQTALRFTLECLLQNFDKDIEAQRYSQLSKWHRFKSRDTEKKRVRKLLILCNKIDQWQEGRWNEDSLANMSQFLFYSEAQRKLEEIVEESKFRERTGFEIVTGMATFLPGKRTHLADALGKLKK